MQLILKLKPLWNRIAELLNESMNLLSAHFPNIRESVTPRFLPDFSPISELG
jgi:hypothetical protein